MSSHKQGLVKALDYMLFNLKAIQKDLFTVDGSKTASAWAIGGLIITLTANLMKISEENIKKSLENNESDAKKDLINIKDDFNRFINAMIDYQDTQDNEK